MRHRHFDPFSPGQPAPCERREAIVLKLVNEQTVRVDVPPEIYHEAVTKRAVTYLLGLERAHRVIRSRVEVRGSVVVGLATFHVDIDLKAFFPEWTNELGLVLYDEINRSQFVQWDAVFHL